MSEYCTTVRRQVDPVPIPGTGELQCPACGLEYDPRRPPHPPRPK